MITENDLENGFVKVFITGATGFIGRHLVRRLVQEGYELRCLVRSRNWPKELDLPGVEFFFGNVNDRVALQKAMDGCDWLFHLANLYSMWEVDPDRFWRVNVEGTRCVLDAALETRIKKVVYVSTAAIYGKPDPLPFDEDSPPGPLHFSEYAHTKAVGNQVAWDFHQRFQLPLVVLYPGIVLGAGDDKASGQYIQDIIFHRVPTTIFHNSASTYVYVGDVVDAMLQAALRPEANGQAYLIGKHILTGKEFAGLISQISGARLPWLHFPDWLVMTAAHLLSWLSGFTRHAPMWGLSVDAARTLKQGFQFDGGKAERDLNINYTSIEQALQEAVASYQKQPRSSLIRDAFFRIFH